MREKIVRVNHNYLKYIMIILLIIISFINIRYTYQRIAWSPVDEIQHYDYIDNLSQFNIPSAKNDITDYTQHITFDVFKYATRDNIGLGIKSYEAHQPPFYYILLAVPNIILKALSIDPIIQIRILRMISLCFIMLGCYFAIPIFYELNKISKINPLHGYLLAIVLLLPYANHRYVLSNDHLSLLLNNIVIYLLLIFWRKQNIVYATWAAFFTALSFLTKYTNGLIFICYGVVFIIYLIKSNKYKSIQDKIKACIQAAYPFFLIVIYLGFNAILYGFHDILNTKITNSYFSSFVLPVTNTFFFISTLIKKSFDFNRINIIPISDIVIIFVLLMILLNFLISNYKLLFKKKYHYIPIVIASTISLMIIISALILNNNFRGVFWFEFRHFYGYGLLWMMSILYCPFFLFNKSGQVIFSCMLLIIFPLILYYTMTHKDFKSLKNSTYIINEGTGKCLERPSNNNFALLVASDCSDNMNQLWRYRDIYNMIFNAYEQECIDIPLFPGFKNETQVELYYCLGNDNQQWFYDYEHHIFKNIKNQCMEVVQRKDKNIVQINECNNNLNQKWIITKDSSL